MRSTTDRLGISAFPAKSKLYLGGPITGIRGGNKAAFNRATKVLRSMGYKVVNPIELDKGAPKKMKWADFIRRDIPHLAKCYGLVLLPKWESSRGAQLEWRIAKDLGMPICYWAWYEAYSRRA